MGNISDDIRERDVEKFFKGYGRVKNVVLKNGYGFAEFEDNRDAQDAVKELDGKSWFGARVRIEFSRDSRGGGDRGRDRRDGGGSGGGRDGSPRRRGNPPGRRTGYRLLIENLSSRTSWQDLKDFMRQAGEIMYTNTHHIRSGEGIVEFGARSDMEYALDKLDGSELDGRRIKLFEENDKKSTSRSRSREKSRDKSRDRSREKDRSRDKDRRDNRSRDRSRERDRSAVKKERSRSNRRSRSRS